MVWSENFHFKPFLDSRAKRERGQDCRSTSNHTQIATNPDHTTNPDRRLTLPFDFDFACLRLRRDRTPGLHIFDFADFACLRLRRDLTPGLHIFDFADFAPFDFVNFARLRSRLRNGWVLKNLTRFVFIYWEMVLYICLEAEKMWEIRRKCVFYIIFSNTTKH